MRDNDKHLLLLRSTPFSSHCVWGSVLCLQLGLEPCSSVLSHTRENVARAKCARCGVPSAQYTWAFDFGKPLL